MRGGSWNNNARNCRVANRNRNNPDNRNNNNGFRLVLSAQYYLFAKISVVYGRLFSAKNNTRLFSCERKFRI
ncbi:MAG: hypothetical protein ISR90_00530 [Candidatus Marinimicrobia bacterium]|nr:hypothetical protein [Candidatus Neomarinimicrobiota bacterium]MBL7022528.1 hypothetical protein [Candidatus Neomarinimicrobiota bacterium]